MLLSGINVIFIFSGVLLVFGKKSPLSNICKSTEGISCTCHYDFRQLQISNCTRTGEWSNWSDWSQCRRGERKRRRICQNAIGSQCSGPSKEKEPCSGKKEKKKVVPNYLWGSWTDWQQWSECDCGRDLTTRTRICRGESCEGCAKEYANCGEKACPSAKKWSPWTEWSSQGRKEIRYTAFCSTSRLNFAEVGFRTDERSKNFSATWSSWSLRAGVAFRHRLTSASDFEVDYQLISRSVRDCVPLNVVVVVGVVATVCGFLVQCISAHVFRRASRTRTDSFLYHCRSPGFPSLLSRKY